MYCFDVHYMTKQVQGPICSICGRQEGLSMWCCPSSQHVLCMGGATTKPPAWCKGTRGMQEECLTQQALAYPTSAPMRTTQPIPAYTHSNALIGQADHQWHIWGEGGSQSTREASTLSQSDPLAQRALAVSGSPSSLGPHFPFCPVQPAGWLCNFLHGHGQHAGLDLEQSGFC